MIEAYRKHVAGREAEGLPPLPLNEKQTAELVALLKNPPAGEEQFLLGLLTHRVPPGVDQAAYVKAGFLADVAKGKARCPLIDARKATELLGTMLGGYNIQPLIDLLANDQVAAVAVEALAKTLLIFDAYHDVIEKSKTNAFAKQVVDAWAEGAWFTRRQALPDAVTVTVLKVPGETNTDDLSPASEAWSRPDIPLHAKSMLVSKMPEALRLIVELRGKGHPLAYVGDVVGTGSSRKSAINSVLWHMGSDIPFVPNKRQGGVVLGGKIAPIFFNTAEDSGALPIECDVTKMNTGDVITIKPFAGVILNERGETISSFKMTPFTLADEVRAGGRIPLIIGRSLTDKTREALGLKASAIFLRPITPKDTGKGFTLAQKMVGRACGVKGIRPGTYCEPRMTTVGS
ncbi:MAG TPA: aconitate hydratase B, partial [Gammaproteobacteria bacterium]